MNKNSKLAIAAVALIANILCMFFFTESYGLVFVANLIFSVIAILLSAYVIIFVGEGKKKTFGISLLAYAYAYVVAVLGVAYRFVFVPDSLEVALAKKTCFAHVVILAVFIIVIILAKAENDFIEEQQEKRGKDLRNFKYTLECMKNVQSKVEYAAPYRKTITHAYDALASNQTASTPEVEDIEIKILDCIEDLEKVVSNNDVDAINECCATIEKLATERKNILASRVTF